MNDETNDVVRARVQAKQLAVQCMREPRQRVPVGLFAGGERPSNGRPAHACIYMRIFDNVFRIVIINEVVSTDRPVKDNRSDE